MVEGHFRNRREAGRRLAEALGPYGRRDDVLVLALPRGGVPVGVEVASALSAPLDVFLVRKLGVPGHEELAMGAIASGGILIINEAIVAAANVDEDEVERAIEQERIELARRERAYRANRPPPAVGDRIIILVDDGLATGSTMRAAARAIRKMHPRRIVAAVPVAASETCAEILDDVDEVVCLLKPEPFRAVGQWYDDFSQTTDAEVEQLLQDAWEVAGTGGANGLEGASYA